MTFHFLMWKKKITIRTFTTEHLQQKKKRKIYNVTFTTEQKNEIKCCAHVYINGIINQILCVRIYNK